eukprot:4287859-Lingulodinium_polyedra.AAC.1
MNGLVCMNSRVLCCSKCCKEHVWRHSAHTSCPWKIYESLTRYEPLKLRAQNLCGVEISLR